MHQYPTCLAKEKSRMVHAMRLTNNNERENLDKMVRFVLQHARCGTVSHNGTNCEIRSNETYEVRFGDWAVIDAEGIPFAVTDHTFRERYDVVVTESRLVEPAKQVPGKESLTCLFRERPDTPEGKYLVLRRDGTIPGWPSFVLGGGDPIGHVALQAYADEVKRLLQEEPDRAERLGLTWGFHAGLLRWVNEFIFYRAACGHSDPGKGPHRKDNPVVLAMMAQGRSA